jgi:hypothetical protein
MAWYAIALALLAKEVIEFAFESPNLIVAAYV